MDVAALIVSVFALVFAGVSASSARRSSGAALRSATAAEDARREARAPQIDWELRSSQGRPLVVRLKSNRDLDRLLISQEWSSGDRDVLAFGGGLMPGELDGALDTFRPPTDEEAAMMPSTGARGPRGLVVDNLRAGVGVSVWVQYGESGTREYGRAILRCLCFSGSDEPWPVTVDTGRVKLDWSIVD
jgi:hypothetical protein